MSAWNLFEHTVPLRIVRPSYGPGNYQSTKTGHDIPIYVSQGAVQGLFLKESIFSIAQV